MLVQRVARELENQREDLTTMLSSLSRIAATTPGVKEAIEQITRARQAVGLARAALLAKERREWI